MNSTSKAVISKVSSTGDDHVVTKRDTGANLPRSTEPVLTEDMLARFAERAASYDRENRFFEEDFEDLRAAKYLLLPVPSEFGGAGMTLAEVCRQQRRLAYYAPATALAVNMHLYWLGVAADLWRRGDASLEWILREAAAGEIFAAGHAESGNDVPVLLSTSKAERVEGGYKFTGRKHFGSLTPVWTRFGLHGMDTSDPSQPKIVHAFMPRNTVGYAIKETWDVLGMRATRSDDTGAGEHIRPRPLCCPDVPARADRLVRLLFARYRLNIYYGLVKSLDQSVIAAKSSSLALSVRWRIARVQHAIAEMAVEPNHRTSSGVGRRGLVQWRRSRRTVARKSSRQNTVRWKVLARGGSGSDVRRQRTFAQRLRTIGARCAVGRIHPANSFHPEVVAKTALGISLDEQPRWG